LSTLEQVNKMWTLVDIAYVIPATVFIGYFLGKFLDAKYGGDYSTYCIMGFAIAGFVLTFFKIKKYVDSCNSNSKNNCSQDLSDDSR
jgi:F0F1-type ATP synthase assembly protein I